jgi:asparagine synthase (glutamine-hydrolysing)
MAEMFTLLNNSHKFTVDFIKQQIESGIRPPNNTNYRIENVMIKALFGGRTVDNVYPIVNINDVVIICDGTIYNSKKLFEELGVEPETDCDYEIIVHLYIRYGIETALRMVDGIFAFVLLDHRLTIPSGELDSVMYIARDPYGVKPLYLLRPNTKNIMIEYYRTDGDIFALSSNIDMLKGLEREMNLIEHPENDALIVKGKPKKSFYIIEPVLPGTYSVFEQKYRVLATWRFIRHQIPYHFCQPGLTFVKNDDKIVLNRLVSEAVIKRIRDDKPTSIVLTGKYEGFITAAVASNKLNQSLSTFTWIDTSACEPDIQRVADYLKTNHIVVSITNDELDSEKENICPSMDVAFWFMAKKIASVAPNSLVFLEIGIDQFLGSGQSKDDETHLDFQYRLSNYLKSACPDRLNVISKIFWYHGLEVEMPWLDISLTRHLVTYSRNFQFMCNPVGIYGNNLLPEELFH